MVEHTQTFLMVEELIEFLTSASEETRCNVDATIKEALSQAVKVENEALVVAILTNFHTNKKVRTVHSRLEKEVNTFYNDIVGRQKGPISSIQGQLRP